jgi:hypothetical protein
MKSLRAGPRKQNEHERVQHILTMKLKIGPIRIKRWGWVANVLTAAIVTLVPFAAWGQASRPLLVSQTPDAQQGDITACQNGLENCNLLSTTPQPPKGNTEKARLAVNPVTGLVSTPTVNFRPLMGRERWKLYWKQNYFSVGAYFGPVFTALVLDQSTGSPPQWGGGFHGYGLRVASRTGSAVVQGTVQAPLAALLHEDVRYVASKDRRSKQRALHAVKYSFLTFNSQGHPTPNVANLAATFAATAISGLWLPGKYAGARYTLTNSTEQIALALPVNIMQEFWPEVVHKVFHRP